MTHDDKRIFPRYKVSDSSAVMLTPGNIFSLCVLDISKSGLAFCYSDTVNESEMLDNALLTFFTENFVSSDIAVQIVCDMEFDEKITVHHSDENRTKLQYLRRCGVKFKQLSREQESTISAYIAHLTKTIVKSDEDVSYIT